MSTTLALKLFLVPLLIWAVTLVGRKWGPTVAGWLSAFPIVSGPILLIISLERGSAFAAHAAEATLLAGALLVLGVTFFATRLGARLSGFLAMFPVMGTVLTGFSHHYCSRAFAVSLLRGTVFGFFAFATFCLLISTQLERLGIASGFVLAFVAALVVQLGVKYAMGRK